MLDQHHFVPSEQLRYARLLDWSAKAGLALLVAGFVAYVLGWLPPTLPLTELPRMWSQPVANYLAATGAPTGWAWIRLVAHGDYAGLVGIAILAGCSLSCLLAVIPIYYRRGDRLFAAICALSVAVLIIAASGLFTYSR